jgi:hypothetical protein
MWFLLWLAAIANQVPRRASSKIQTARPLEYLSFLVSS